MNDFFWIRFNQLFGDNSLLHRNIADNLSKYPKDTWGKACTFPQFPPSECFLGDNDSLHLNFAMAGYCRDDVEVKSDNNQLNITAKENVSISGKSVLFSSIKRKPIDITLAIDKVYDAAKAKVEFLDGMLKINIPRAEGSECKKLF